MLVTGIELYKSKRYKIYIDESFAFALYGGEIRRYHLEEGDEITEDVYREIMDEIIIKRAKKRTLHLLLKMPRTEHQIRQKLKENLYPEEAIDLAVDYAKSYRYIDDKNYAGMYIRDRLSTKSQKQLKMELQQKGISSEIITETLEATEGIDEIALIQKLVQKKKIDPQTASPKDIQKLYAFLMRKGFDSGDIRQVLFSRDNF